MARIVVFGATGYTGELTVRLLGADPTATESLVLAGRSDAKLKKLAEQIEAAREEGPPLSTAVADISDPASVRALLEDSSDVIVSTVGPFIRWGRPAIEAAISAGATYLDSTGEPAFLREVFESDSARAKKTGARLIPAFGFDYVPGNLAGALVLADATAAASPVDRVDIGYFMPGGVGMSSGTAATGAGIVFEPSYGFREGVLTKERAGKQVGTFEYEGGKLQGVSVGGTEQFGLPRQASTLREVRVFVGALGKFSRPVSVASAGLNAIVQIPGVKSGLQATAARFVKGSRGGPDAAARSRVLSLVIAEAFDTTGERIGRVVVEGPSPYDLTAHALAWGAANSDRMIATGTLAPTDAFTLTDFVQGCASFGLKKKPSERGMSVRTIDHSV